MVFFAGFQYRLIAIVAVDCVGIKLRLQTKTAALVVNRLTFLSDKKIARIKLHSAAIGIHVHTYTGLGGINRSGVIVVKTKVMVVAARKPQLNVISVDILSDRLSLRKIERSAGNFRLFPDNGRRLSA